MPFWEQKPRVLLPKSSKAFSANIPSSMKMNLTNLRIVHCMLWNNRGWTVSQLSKVVDKSRRHVRNILHCLMRMGSLTRKEGFGRGGPFVYFLKERNEFSSFRPLDSRSILFVQPYLSFPRLDRLLKKDHSELEEELRVMRIEHFCEEARVLRRREDKLRWCATVIFARIHIFGRKERVAGVFGDSSGNLGCGDCTWEYPPKDSILR